MNCLIIAHTTHTSGKGPIVVPYIKLKTETCTVCNLPIKEFKFMVLGFQGQFLFPQAIGFQTVGSVLRGEVKLMRLSAGREVKCRMAAGQGSSRKSIQRVFSGQWWGESSPVLPGPSLLLSPS